jgi:hypothetical protein
MIRETGRRRGGKKEFCLFNGGAETFVSRFELMWMIKIVLIYAIESG